eukprot:8938786-Ditylum_brightwellii.AAC.1
MSRNLGVNASFSVSYWLSKSSPPSSSLRPWGESVKINAKSSTWVSSSKVTSTSSSDTPQSV